MTSRRSSESFARDQGSATIWACAWIGLLLTIGLVAISAAAAAAAQHRLDAAADLTALSAAARLQRGEDACAAASTVAARNDARVIDCQLFGEDVVIRLAAPLALPFHLRATVTSVARAGPAS